MKYFRNALFGIANRSCFDFLLFSVLALLDASIGMIVLWFQYHSHTPMIRYQLWPLEQIWIVVEHPQHLAWAEQYANIISNHSYSNSLIIKNHFLTALMFSSVVDVPGGPGRASSLIFTRPSLDRLYHNWTCVLLIVDSPNATVNISNHLAHLISYFAQNLIQFLWSNFSNSKKSKSTPQHD